MSEKFCSCSDVTDLEIGTVIVGGQGHVIATEVGGHDLKIGTAHIIGILRREMRRGRKNWNEKRKDFLP